MGKRGLSVSYAVEYIILAVKDRVLLLNERQRLLDALGHADCVPRSEHNRECNDLTSQHIDEVSELGGRNMRLRDRAERAERELERVKQEKAGMTHRAYRILPNDDTDGHSGETWREFAADEGMARIEAERERDALRADNDRLREALRDAVTWIEVVPGSSWLHDKQGLLRRARAALSADAEPERRECAFCGATSDANGDLVHGCTPADRETQSDCATQKKES